LIQKIPKQEEAQKIQHQNKNFPKNMKKSKQKNKPMKKRTKNLKKLTDQIYSALKTTQAQISK